MTIVEEEMMAREEEEVLVSIINYVSSYHLAAIVSFVLHEKLPPRPHHINASS